MTSFETSSDWAQNIIRKGTPIREALNRLNTISDTLPERPLTLFIEDEGKRVIGTLTDGDIRRNLVKNGHILDDPVEKFMFSDFVYIRDGMDHYTDIKMLFSKGIDLLPVLSSDRKIVRIYNLNVTRAVLPVHAVIMAGGEGMRLRPLTDNIPKPMLKIGNKPIIERNIDRMIRYGINNVTISVRYLGQQIIDYFGDGESRGLNIDYVKEKRPLGTLGSVSLIDNMTQDTVLVMNSDILSTINLAAFYDDFEKKKADMSVVTIPYKVKVPYAVLGTRDEVITDLKEKPEFVYYSNAGIYLIRRSLLRNLNREEKLDITDFMEDVMRAGGKVTSYPFWGYWVDIGHHDDFANAERTIKILEDE